MIQSSTRFMIEQLGDLPQDTISCCHRNGLYTVQELLDKGIDGCRSMGLGEEDILAMGEMLDKNGFERLE